MIRRVRWQRGFDFLANRIHKNLLRLSRFHAALQKFPRQRTPFRQPFFVQPNMFPGVLDESEMSQEDSLQSPRSNRIQRLIPDFHVDIRRGRGRKKKRIALHPNSRAVTHKSRARRAIPIRHMMRSVPRCVEDF